MKSTGVEFFTELMEYHNDSNDIKAKYARMRSLLERVSKDLTSEESVQFSNLFSRLNFVCSKTQLERRKTYQINTFRINANNVLHSNFSPTREVYLQDMKAISNAISHFYSIEIPRELFEELPANDVFRPSLRPNGQRYSRVRVEVDRWDETFIYGYDEEHPTEIKIKHNVEGVNSEFNTTISSLWKGAQLNLIDITLDDSGIYFPQFLVLEPDYLIDISAIAECFKEEGSNALNFVRSKLETIPNKHYLLLGNIANMFLDELINEEPHLPVSYGGVMKKAFKSSPFEFSACMDIPADFNATCQMHFLSIKEIITNSFPREGIDRNQAILEPSFICEKLGIQGRLDLTLQDFSRIIELKSGSAQTFPAPIKIKENNYIQTLLYYAVLKFNIQNNEDRKAYILYSKHKELMWAQKLDTLTKEAINKRNEIITNERKVANSTEGIASRQIIELISVERIITRELPPNFRDNYIVPQIQEFKSHFDNASPLELDYFHFFYSFVTKEHFLSKAGDTEYEGSRGISTLWLSTFEEKKEAGEILVDLTIQQNLMEEEPATLRLTIPPYDFNFLPNFRKGDIIILYERNSATDSVTNKQVFKGAIEKLNSNEITLRFRNKQRNKSVLPGQSKYAIEHDFLDSSYNTMYRSLYSFLQANKERRALLLNQRNPAQDTTKKLVGDYGSPEMNDVILKAKQAKDYFILVGPPGTGKTSIALKSMIEEFYSDQSLNIILLSYTNRAVDEICNALDKANGKPPYIRIGNELSCEEQHRDRLLERVIKNCETREQVKSTIQNHRIFVGTVSSFSNKTELFKLKRFEVAIIDEASQILEPQILGILSAKDAWGKNAIDKFILIGDHKQLPAVVMQSSEDSAIELPELNRIGLVDRRNSLFERLYRLNNSASNSVVTATLHKQGRMHPEISLFPNYAFYKSKLVPVPTAHQVDELNFARHDKQKSIEVLISTKRVCFIPSEKSKTDKSNKINSNEASIVASLVRTIYDLYQKNSLVFSPEKSIGVIAPYRSQIALIKHEINKLSNPDLDRISVDTVERFQGSERDIIIYSFSVNQYYQLDFLANNIEEDGVLIDRKLNVAITRAKKQLFITGNPNLLSNNLTYFRLIEFIRSKGGFVNCNTSNFLKGSFKIEDADTDQVITENIYEPDPDFAKTYNKLVIDPIKMHPKTQYPSLIYGNDSDFNRLNVIEFGRANFSDQGSLFGYTQHERVNLYCFYNMRKHYFSSYAIFKSFSDFFNLSFANTANRISFFDLGCGPATSGLAFNQYFGTKPNFHFNYIGIDTASSMLEKGKQFLTSGIFSKDTKYLLKESLNSVPKDYQESIFALSNTVILNFSYLFGNLSKEDAERMADQINTIMDKFPLNRYVLLYQNSSLEKRNRTYSVFKKLVSRLKPINNDMPKTETITYRNAEMSHYDKTETVFYEILSN
jgi:hypothetical protein